MDWRLYAILAAFFASLTALLAKLGVQDIPSNLATLIRTVVVLILISVTVIFTGEFQSINSVRPRTWIFLLGSGICTGLSWLFYFRAIQLGPISSVAPIDKMSLALTVALGILVLGESFSWKTIISTALILAGTILMLAK